LITESTELNTKVQGEKELLKKSLDDTTLYTSEKQKFIKQLNANHVNIEPIRVMIANIVEKRPKIKNITSAIPNSIKPAKKQQILNEYDNGASNNKITAMIKDALFDEFRDPIREKIKTGIPGTFGLFRVGWEQQVARAKTKEELSTIEKLLDEKIALRSEIEKSNITEKDKRGHISWIMKYSNDITKRRQLFKQQMNPEEKQKLNASLDAKRKSLLNRIGRNVASSNNMSQAPVKWKNAIKSAKNEASIEKIEKLLNDKVNLKQKTIEAIKNLPQTERDRYTKILLHTPMMLLKELKNSRI